MWHKAGGVRLQDDGVPRARGRFAANEVGRKTSPTDATLSKFDTHCLELRVERLTLPSALRNDGFPSVREGEVVTCKKVPPKCQRVTKFRSSGLAAERIRFASCSSPSILGACLILIMQMSRQRGVTSYRTRPCT